MTFKNFEIIIKQLTKIRNNGNIAYNLGIDLIYYDEPFEKVMRLLIEEIYDDKGYDVIQWWLEEKIENKKIAKPNTEVKFRGRISEPKDYKIKCNGEVYYLTDSHALWNFMELCHSKKLKGN